MTDVRETGLNVFRELLPGIIPDGETDLPRGGFADELYEISVDNVFGRLWGRDGLSRRDAASLHSACSSRCGPPTNWPSTSRSHAPTV